MYCRSDMVLSAAGERIPQLLLEDDPECRCEFEEESRIRLCGICWTRRRMYMMYMCDVMALCADESCRAGERGGRRIRRS